MEPQHPKRPSPNVLDTFRLLRAPSAPTDRTEPEPPVPPAIEIISPADGLLDSLALLHAGNELATAHDITSILGRVLAKRGFVPGEETARYLRPRWEELPRPEALKGSSRFCEILSGAARSKDKVAVIHDYDVDGTMSAVIMSSTLSALKIPHKLFAPDRTLHGYGVAPQLVQQAADKGYKVLVCLDVGTTNHRSISLARELGMKVIVIDHHEMKPKSARARVPSPPRASTFINPHRAGCGFSSESCCAAGLTWFAVARLKEHLARSKRAKSRAAAGAIDLQELSGFAALATVADVVPLRGANRILVRLGLPHLQSSRRIGVRKLLDHAGGKGSLRASDVAFKIAPRINAAGRMMEFDRNHGAGAATVTKLFLTDKLKKAEKYADLLNLNNQLRKEVEARVVTEAETMMRTLPRLPDGITLWSRDFHPGVIGLGAARIADRYYRPTLVFQVREDGTAKCSARGAVKGFSVIQAFRDLEQMVGRESLREYGGHEGAGGATVATEALPEIRSAWELVCARQLDHLGRTPTVTPDVEMTLGEVAEQGVALVQQLELIQPTGAANPAAKFLVRGVRVLAAQIIKGRHLELMLQQRDPLTGVDAYATGILWHRTDHPALTAGGAPSSPLHPSRPTAAQVEHLVDLVCHPELDEKNRHTPNKKGVFLQIFAAQIASERGAAVPAH